MQLKAIFVLTALFLSASASPSPLTSSDLVKYGSGSAYVEKREDCSLEDPGAVCAGLAASCKAAISKPPTGTLAILWTIVTCVAAGIWFVFLSSYPGHPDVKILSLITGVVAQL